MSENSDNVPGCKQLWRLETFLYVAYATLFVDFIMHLPSTDNLAWTQRPFGLPQFLVDNSVDPLRLGRRRQRAPFVSR
jgi:hypothetical protein